MGSNFYFGPGMYFQTGQVIFVPKWPKGEFVSILAYYSEVLQSQKIFSSLSAVRTIEPSRPDSHLSPFHPSGRLAIRSVLQTYQASSARTRCLSVRTLHYVEKVLSSLHPSERFSSTSGRLSLLEQSKILSKFQ